jgi:SRSO17 transposase
MEDVTMAVMDAAADWARGLDELVERIAPRFRRIEPRRRVRAYLQGLLAPIERKNGWQLAENAGDRTPDGVQDFLARMRWDADQVRDDLQAYVIAQLGDADAVLVLDETGFIKKGTKSVGVQRQYSGTAGRIENCQIGVFLGYASRHGHALIDRALYLPEVWANDPARRDAAGVPVETVFATKPHLGRQMLSRAFAAGVPCRWVTGDSVYGADYALRRSIEKSGRGYVLAVTRRQRLGFKTVADWLEDVPSNAWQRLSAGEGAKGPRLYDWAWLPQGADAASGWQKGLLIRRKLAQPEAFTFYLTLAPEAAGLADLVRVAGTRWTIEASFEAAKGEVGLDQYEVRSWTGWHRPITLAMLAHAWLAVIRAAAGGEKKACSTSTPICCRSPCRKYAVCFGAWSGPSRLTARPPASGRAGAAGISSEPAKAIGNGELRPNSGCSTKQTACE